MKHRTKYFSHVQRIKNVFWTQCSFVLFFSFLQQSTEHLSVNSEYVFEVWYSQWKMTIKGESLTGGGWKTLPPLPPRLIKGTIQFYSWPFWNYCCVSPFWIPQGISGGRKQILTQNLHFKLEVLLLKFLFLSMYLNFPINSKLVYLNVPDSMMKLVKF